MGVKYSGVFIPGGLYRNTARTLYFIPPLGDRYNGTFYDEQLKFFSNGSIKSFFNLGAMFDEYTEGTSILPMLKNLELPSNPNPGFLGTDDDMDTFYYMDFSGKYTVEFHAFVRAGTPIAVDLIVKMSRSGKLWKQANGTRTLEK